MSPGPHYSDPRLMSKINDQYKLRDSCLAKNAVPYVAGDSDVSNIARAVSLSCQPETEKLVSLSNPTHDPAITAAIQKDSVFRATGYVLRARGEGSTN